MRTARVTTIAPEGIHGQVVTVEVAARPGISSLKIVGLAGRTVSEAKERVRVALRTIGVRLPATNIVVNLAPAEMQKVGTHYDLPIALGLLIATEVLPMNCLDQTIVAGELALNGELRPYRQSAVIALSAERLQQRLLTATGFDSFANLTSKLKIATATNLSNLINDLKNDRLQFTMPRATSKNRPASPQLLEDLIGLEQPKRAVVLAAAGQHHLLLCGPPGVGKSRLANAARSLMPDLSLEERQALTALHGRLINDPPWRAPHHSATPTALLGGGNELKPGELSLAHAGILFLDELPRFPLASLQAILEPLELGQIMLARDNRSVEYPARPLVIGAYNPCPCGYYGDAKHACRCTAYDLARYQSRLSGPLVSRFTIFAPCLSDNLPCHLTTAQAWQQIEVARQMIVRRHQTSPNSQVDANMVRTWLDSPRLASAANRLLDLGRSWRHVINAGRLARTIADLRESDTINSCDLQEAIAWLPPNSIS